jgi:hypothetical protein
LYRLFHGDIAAMSPCHKTLFIVLVDNSVENSPRAVSPWAMERESGACFRAEKSRPLPIIGVRRAMVQGEACDDALFAPNNPLAEHRSQRRSCLAGGGGDFAGGGRGVRAEWQEWPKTPAGLKRIAATARGSRWQAA